MTTATRFTSATTITSLKCSDIVRLFLPPASLQSPPQPPVWRPPLQHPWRCLCCSVAAPPPHTAAPTLWSPKTSTKTNKQEKKQKPRESLQPGNRSTQESLHAGSPSRWTSCKSSPPRPSQSRHRHSSPVGSQIKGTIKGELICRGRHRSNLKDTKPKGSKEGIPGADWLQTIITSLCSALKWSGWCQSPKTVPVLKHFCFKQKRWGRPMYMDQLICCICSKVMAVKGNSENMNAHLRHNHPLRFSQMGKKYRDVLCWSAFFCLFVLICFDRDPRLFFYIVLTVVCGEYFFFSLETRFFYVFVVNVFLSVFLINTVWVHFIFSFLLSFLFVCSSYLKELDKLKFSTFDMVYPHYYAMHYHYI